MRYVIEGWSAVFDPEGNEVTDPRILRGPSGYTLPGYATDYLGGSEVQDALAVALEQSGQLRFEYREGETSMRVMNEFTARRLLTDEELHELVQDTVGLCYVRILGRRIEPREGLELLFRYAPSGTGV